MADVSINAPGGPPGPRLSDEDRERVVEILKTSCSEGRLTLDEFSERVGIAYQAVSLDELLPVLTDLPHPFGPELAGLIGGPAGDLPVAAPPPLPDLAGGRKVTRWTVSIMGGSQRKGRWRLREKTNAVAVMGGCQLDLRNAEVEGPDIVINAVAVMGGIEIIVPEGIEVELGGIAIMGGKDARRLKDVPPLPGSPVIRVRAFAFWGGVTVRSKPAHVARGPRSPRLSHHHSPLTGGPSDPGPQVIDVVADALGDVGIGLQPSELPQGTVTIMFSDIEGFTAITERLGDRRAMDVLREHNGIIRQRVANSGGHEIKAQGDGFMIAFGGASSALHCALGIQGDFAARNGAHPDVPVQVRLGLHAGEAVRDGDDFLGGAVILAARIAEQAKGGEILVSSVLKDLCDLSGEFQFEHGRDVYLKGVSEPRRVYSVSVTGPDN
jgi:class 3 adenylate cyclase